MRLRVTHTYSTTNIVMLCDNNKTRIYAEDYSFDTAVKLPTFVARQLTPEHVRMFTTMREFTEWLQEVGAIVDKCVCAWSIDALLSE